MNEVFYEIVDQICESDSRYHPDAYEFVMDALSFTQKKYRRSKHVNGNEFLEGIKGLLLKQYGPMTIPLLRFWGISKTDDFGNIIYNLEQHKIISRDDNDQYESFKDRYDFQEVFENGYRKDLAKKLKTMRF